MHLLLQILAWLIALSWLTRTLAAQRGLPTIPNLLDPQYDSTPTETLTVIVPARNEARDIRATLESLLAQDYANIKIIAVDDRGTDTTGHIIALGVSLPLSSGCSTPGGHRSTMPPRRAKSPGSRTVPART